MLLDLLGKCNWHSRASELPWLGIGSFSLKNRDLWLRRGRPRGFGTFPLGTFTYGWTPEWTMGNGYNRSFKCLISGNL